MWMPPLQTELHHRAMQRDSSLRSLVWGGVECAMPRWERAQSATPAEALVDGLTAAGSMDAAHLKLLTSRSA